MDGWMDGWMDIQVLEVRQFVNLSICQATKHFLPKEEMSKYLFKAKMQKKVFSQAYVIEN